MRHSSPRSTVQRPLHAFQPTHVQHLQTILDRTCDELKIDRRARETRPMRDFLGRQLLRMTQYESDAADALVEKLTARARTFGFNQKQAAEKR